MTVKLQRALETARKAEAKAARIQARETLLSNLRTMSQLVRQDEYHMAGDLLASTAGLITQLASPAEKDGV